MQTLRQDLTYAFQQIRRGKGIAATVVLMIAIGIGAGTAIFGLFKATLRQAPFREIDHLVRILTAYVYGITTSDPLTLAAVVAMVVGTALLATAVPVRRATRVDPMTTLRAE